MPEDLITARNTGAHFGRKSRRRYEGGQVVLNADFIPDEETEVYFKAADAVILPYRQIYQSGVLFLGHSFGLPVLAADVGSLKDDIVEGKTGFTFRPEDPVDLARAIKQYFASDLYADLNSRRQQIKDYANERHSWEVVSQMTTSVYAGLLRKPSPGFVGRFAQHDVRSLGRFICSALRDWQSSYADPFCARKGAHQAMVASP